MTAGLQLLLVLLALLPSIPQRTGPGDLGDPLQPVLSEASRRFAQAWSDGDAGALGQMMSPSGVRLNLEGGGHASVGVRQATAALRDLHALHRPGPTRVTRVSDVDGTPPRGFVELGWRTITGAGEPRAFSLFVGFLLEDGVWRVSEIRVLR